MSDYSSFVETVVPTAIGLSGASIEFDRAVYWLKINEPLERSLVSRYRVDSFSGDHFNVIASYEFSIRSLERPTADGVGVITTPLKIACTFDGHFHAKDVSEERAEKFTRRSAWLILWPYFRQFVSDTTARMGIPPETLPLALGPGAASAKPGPPELPGDVKSEAEPKPRSERRRVASRRRKRPTSK